MTTFIAQRIEEAYTLSPEKGHAKYKAYFINTPIYARWRAEVDSILIVDGYEAAIVA